MPHLDQLAVLLWVAGALANAAVLCAMAWTDAWRRWPSLFAFLALVNAQEGWCAASHLYDHPAGYFYGYYAFAILEDMAEVWLITEIALGLAGVTPKLRRRIVRAVPITCAVALCGTAALTFTGAGTSAEYVPAIASRLDLAVALAWMAAFVSLPFAARFFHIQWSGDVRPVAIGFWIEAMCTLLAAYAIGAANRLMVTDIKASLYLLSLLCWSAPVVSWRVFRRVPHHARIPAGMTTTGPERASHV